MKIRLSPSTRRAWIEIEDKNTQDFKLEVSPSTRRAWIEIVLWVQSSLMLYEVALHPEGVDRNHSCH